MTMTAVLCAIIAARISGPLQEFLFKKSSSISEAAERHLGVRLLLGVDRLQVGRGGSPGVYTEFKPLADKPSRNVLTLHVTKDSIRATRELYLDKTDPLIGQLKDSVMKWNPETDLIFAEVFGQVLANRRAMNFSPADLEIDESSSHARLRSTSEPLRFAELLGEGQTEITVDTNSGDFPAAVSEVVVNTDGVRLIPGTPIPRHQEPKVARFVADAEGQPSNFRFSLILPKAETAASTPRSIFSVLSQFNSGYRAAQPLLLGLLYSTPFVLFLSLRRYPEFEGQSARSRSIEIGILFLILYSGLALTRFISDLLLEPKFWTWVRRFDIDVFNGAGALMVVFPVIVWPAVTRAWERRLLRSDGDSDGTIVSEPNSKTSKILTFCSILVWLAALTLAVLVAVESLRQKLSCEYVCYFRVTVACFIAAVIGLLLSSFWLIYEGLGKRRIIGLTLSAVVTMFVYMGLEDVAYFFRAGPFLAAALLVPVVFSFIRVGIAATSQSFFSSSWRNQSRTRRLVLTLCLAGVAFLLAWPSEHFGRIAIWYHVSTVTWAIGRLGIILLLFILIRILRDLAVGADSLTLSPPALATGEALALSFFFLPSRGWLFLLVLFPLGYLFLRRWIFKPRTQGILAQEGADKLRVAVRDKIRLKDAERSLRVLRKEMLGKLGKGEINFAAFTEKVSELERVVDENGSVPGAERADDSREALASGPRISPWERAKTGASYGFLFSIPWAMLFIRNFVNGDMPRDYASLISIVSSAALTLSQWPLFGLFFGYFYPHIRGSDGIRKGLSFFVFIFVPYATATAIVNPTASGAWSAFVVWSLQLFIQSMLLGLIAGDYETLRRAGLGWRHLIDVHNLGALTAWGSSVLVAIGAAVTTLLTSNAVGFISAGLKVILPDVQPPGGK